jgi:hypothetical protein
MMWGDVVDAKGRTPRTGRSARKKLSPFLFLTIRVQDVPPGLAQFLALQVELAADGVLGLEHVGVEEGGVEDLRDGMMDDERVGVGVWSRRESSVRPLTCRRDGSLFPQSKLVPLCVHMCAAKEERSKGVGARRRLQATEQKIDRRGGRGRKKQRLVHLSWRETGPQGLGGSVPRTIRPLILSHSQREMSSSVTREAKASRQIADGCGPLSARKKHERNPDRDPPTRRTNYSASVRATPRHSSTHTPTPTPTHRHTYTLSLSSCTFPSTSLTGAAAPGAPAPLVCKAGGVAVAGCLVRVAIGGLAVVATEKQASAERWRAREVAVVAWRRVVSACAKERVREFIIFSFCCPRHRRQASRTRTQIPCR